MIPPPKTDRLKSIRRYLTDRHPKEYGAGHPTAVLNSRAEQIDKAMLREFEQREQTVMEAMMKKGTWGTEPGLRSFRTDRLEIWHAVLDNHLPTTSAQAPQI